MTTESTPSTDTTPEDVSSPPNPVGGVSFLEVTGIALFVALVTVIIALLGYRHFVDRPVHFAIVDVQAIVEAKQLQLASMVTTKTVTDKERGAAYDAASRFGRELQDSLNTVQAECDCLLLTAGATVAENVPDLTNRVKELVGLAGADNAVLRRQLERGMRFDPDFQTGKE
jgi:hypothetical protein